MKKSRGPIPNGSYEISELEIGYFVWQLRNFTAWERNFDLHSILKLWSCTLELRSISQWIFWISLMVFEFLWLDTVFKIKILALADLGLLLQAVLITFFLTCAWFVCYRHYQWIDPLMEWALKVKIDFWAEELYLHFNKQGSILENKHTLLPLSKFKTIFLSTCNKSQ